MNLKLRLGLSSSISSPSSPASHRASSFMLSESHSLLTIIFLFDKNLPQVKHGAFNSGHLFVTKLIPQILLPHPTHPQSYSQDEEHNISLCISSTSFRGSQLELKHPLFQIQSYTSTSSSFPSFPSYFCSRFEPYACSACCQSCPVHSSTSSLGFPHLIEITGSRSRSSYLTCSTCTLRSTQVIE